MCYSQALSLYMARQAAKKAAKEMQDEQGMSILTAHALATTLTAQTGRVWRKQYHFVYEACTACSERHLADVVWSVTDGTTVYRSKEEAQERMAA